VSPRFSVIITSCNQRDFIADAVNSALALQGQKPEIIVVDDASSDGSEDVLAAYGDAIRFVPLSTNRGKGPARNAGSSAATSDYLVFLDGDDALLPWTLQVYERVVQARTPKLILASMLWFKGALPPVQEAERPTTIQFAEYADYMAKDRAFGVSASSVVIERQAFESVGGWADISVMQDQDLVIRLSDAGRAVHVLAPQTVLHRSHGGQTIHSVPPFIDVLHGMILRESAGSYPGGNERRFERHALLGGLVLFWTKRALKAGLYADATTLFARGWQLVLAASTRRLSVRVKGRSPMQTLDL
jgi:glycosyltransferase involved in cell wall biosynthesis